MAGRFDLERVADLIKKEGQSCPMHSRTAWPLLRVDRVAPGLIETEIAHVLADEAMKRIVGDTPLGRIGQPDEIASVIRFLLSEESSFMTGETLSASGGRVTLP
jgi:NAD(P)-dependent dehydrogenase (short-subunit alcohol dehydrogenase family)